MKYTGTIIRLSVVAAIAAAAVSCTMEETFEPNSLGSLGLRYVGDPVEAYLDLGVSGYMNVGTKAEDDKQSDEAGVGRENLVNDIWVFQYDASTDKLVSFPLYITVGSEADLSKIKLVDENNYELSNNDGSPCVVYVVANTGDPSWVPAATDLDALSTTAFATVGGLLAIQMDTPKPYRMEYDSSVEGKYKADEGWELLIPMEGNSEEWTTAGGTTTTGTSGIITSGCTITVNAKRMFAKVCIRMDFTDFAASDFGISSGDAFSGTEIYNVTVGNIPEYMTVGPLGDENTTTAYKYPSDVQWLSRSFEKDTESTNTTSEDYYPYVIYVPENIQGEKSATSGKTEDAPDQALFVTANVTVNITSNGNPVSLGPVSFTVYPGGTSSDSPTDGHNYNIRRNCIYYVTITVKDMTEDDFISASANCIFCPSSTTGAVTTAFYPYCREDEYGPLNNGENLKFSDFLDYEYEDSDGSPTPVHSDRIIRSVKIIWQSADGVVKNTNPGYIGNNGGNDYVWVDDPINVSGLTAAQATNKELHRKIYVKIPANKTGNALIAAYNTTNPTASDEPLWSWHIWTRLQDDTDNPDPTNPANGKLYYTYAWDSNGIKYNQSRVSGYVIMNCALGAMKDKPDGSSDYAPETYGLLYQWGRKDPFPAGVYLPSNPNMPLGYEDTYMGWYSDDSDNQVYMTANNTSSTLFHSVGGDERGSDVGSSFMDYINYSIHHPTVFLNPMTRNLSGHVADWDDQTKPGSFGSGEVGAYLTYLENYDNFYGDQTGAYLDKSYDTFVTPYDGNWIYDSSDAHNDLWGGDISVSETSGVNFTAGHFSLPGNITDPYNERTWQMDQSVTIYNNYGSKKSIFDPCPVGWRVASMDCWLGFTNVDHIPDWLSQINYESMDHHGFWMYLTGWKDGSDPTFFPCQGRRYEDGVFTSIGTCGAYWTAQGESKNSIYVNDTHFHYSDIYNTTVYQFEKGYKYEIGDDGFLVYDENGNPIKTGDLGDTPVLDQYNNPVPTWLDKGAGLSISTTDADGNPIPIYTNGSPTTVTTSQLIGHFSLFELKVKANAHPVRCVRFDSLN